MHHGDTEMGRSNQTVSAGSDAHHHQPINTRHPGASRGQSLSFSSLPLARPLAERAVNLKSA